MLKSERGNQQKQQKRTPPRKLCNELATLWRFGLLKPERNGGGAFISHRFTMEWSFCTSEQRTKRKQFTDLRGIRFVCGRTIQANYFGEL